MTDINLFKVGDVYILTRLSDYAVVEVLLPVLEWSRDSGTPYTPDDLASALNGSYRNSSIILSNPLKLPDVVVKCKSLTL
jgi:hypothetical protein